MGCHGDRSGDTRTRVIPFRRMSERGIPVPGGSVHHAGERSLLLRNCALEQLAGVAVDEGEAEIGGALTQAANDALAVPGVVGGGPCQGLNGYRG